ncbi:MAG: hypothetical protein ACPHOK_06355 [Akkermansiaceae bacterium]
MIGTQLASSGDIVGHPNWDAWEKISRFSAPRPSAKVIVSLSKTNILLPNLLTRLCKPIPSGKNYYRRKYMETFSPKQLKNIHLT